MLSIEKCRAHLPRAGEGLTDMEVERIRDGFVAIAGVVLERLKQPGAVVHMSGEVFGMVASDLREEAEERAAIMEFEGGLPRDRAERAALTEVLQLRPRV